MRYALKPFVFTVVCCVTWMLTAQLRARPAAPPANRPQEPGIVKRLGPPPALPVNAYTPKTSGYGQVRSFSVEPVGGKAFVSFDVSLRNRIPGTFFLWVLRVFSPDNTLLNRIDYDDQVFTPEQGVEMHPTFRDLVDVPRGRSRVMVTLYQLPKEGWDLVHGSIEDGDRYSGLQHFNWIEMP